MAFDVSVNKSTKVLSLWVFVIEALTRSESKNAFSAVLSTEGRVVGLCWAKLKPKGSPLHDPLHWRAKRDPKAKMLSLQSFLRKGVSLAYVGSI